MSVYEKHTWYLDIKKPKYVVYGRYKRTYMFQAALYTIVPRSPFFAFLYSKILPVTKMRLNVCFNEMALFGLFAALIKACNSYGRNGGQFTRGDG